MKTTLVCVGIWLGAVCVGAAQTAPAYPYRTVTYLAPGGAVLPGPEGAKFRKEEVFRDSLSGSVRLYDAAGNLKESTPYADIKHQIMLGPHTTFYDNGNVRTKIDFVGNKRQGELLVYYPEGKLKRKETYEADQRKTGECFAPDGSVVAYFPYEVMPSYKGGGTEAFVRAIQMNVRYPAEALRAQTQGRVFVAFTVAASGQVENIKIVKGVSDALDAATIAAVKKLTGVTPGKVDGEPVAVHLTVPITYTITAEPTPFRNEGRGMSNPY
ncbi:energy transducer TonB [Hymenobacter arizonensis]|uniref:Protein TonB n=1 Tax=Hymenobacter arizonensis TaxID=1227077 RepID=A0A1I5TY20_HYMAR|nr:energy transducer TonB [Hymenobacter arizonensis]SFP87811.1 protein TonB [Hymenobacter arizonensis]